MAIPVDLRIKKTYRALFDAFTELLEEHRFEDLTVAMPVSYTHLTLPTILLV